MVNKVLLIMPNFNWKAEFEVQKDPPMGLLYIASCLMQNNYDVCIVDANAEALTLDQAIYRINYYKPNIVGISANYSPLNNLSLMLAKKIKEFNKNILVVIGGNHATASYKYMLKNSSGNVDFIIRGQGERVLINLLNGINKNQKLSSIKGISYISDNRIISNEDEDLIPILDEIPLPAYSLVNMELYDRYNIITSRGCPYRCTYCASSVICSKVFYRSSSKIVEEIEFLIKNYGQKPFWFSDDTFTSNYKHTNELLDLLIEKKIELVWSCLTRVNRTEKVILEKMKLTGCKYISYGVESGDPAMLNQMNKNITLDEIKLAMQLTKEVGIDMYTFFLIGYPGENETSVRKSFDLVKEVEPTGASFAIVIPLPGTKLWDYLANNGYIEYDNIQWDYLFAKSGKSKYENYAADLASKWCDIPKQRLIALCEEGEQLISDSK